MQSRKWFIRITKENKTENGTYIYDYDNIYNILTSRYSRVALVEEVGTESEKEHAHILLQNDNGIRFDTLKKIMPYGDIQVQRGTVLQCIDYMSKQNPIKSSVPLTEFEDADIQGKRTDLELIYNCLKDGKSTYDIISTNNNLLLQVDKIERARQLILTEKYKSTLRLELKSNVYYVFGNSGVGKTSSIFEKHGYENVYRVTDYKHAFDNYQNQEVIVFEEFRNSLKIEDMLNYLDIYPITLPSRYSNKVACYTTVYICSNWALGQQYPEVQAYYKETYNALLRRITKVREFFEVGQYKDLSVMEHFLLKDNKYIEQTKLPF
jgi:hypothetical protein